MMTMTNPKKVRTAWEEKGAVAITEFICACGCAIIGREGCQDNFVMESHGCGRRDVEFLRCDGCGRIWEGEWGGMSYYVSNDPE